MSSPAPLALVLSLLFVGAAPSPARFDQRQDGELNVRADFENFVILVVPTSRANAGLLDLLSKTAPVKSFKRKLQPKERNPDKQHFIESKTAPYHVDLTKLEADNAGKITQEVQIVESTTVSNDGGPKRSQKAFVLTSWDAGKRSRADQNSVDGEKTEPKGELVLIGATEQCGPGMVRDHEGICRRMKV